MSTTDGWLKLKFVQAAWYVRHTSSLGARKDRWMRQTFIFLGGPPSAGEGWLRSHSSPDSRLAISWLRQPNCRLRAVLIEQLFPNFSSFFSQEKQERQEKQETKFGNLTEGKIFWKASHSNIWKKKERGKLWKYNKWREKKNWKFRQKVLR